MVVGVIDGMGGGIGSQVVTSLRKMLPADLVIIALGTNPLATGNMMKAGANQGASGENALIFSVQQLEVIIAPLAVAIPNAMWGEVSLAIAEAISLSRARKYFLPILPDNIELLGLESRPLLLSIREIIDKLQKELSSV